MTAPDDDDLLAELLDALTHIVATYRARARQAADERVARLAALYEAPALGAHKKKETT